MDKIIILSALGFLISAYAYYVRKKSLNEKDYKPICDLSSKISCSKVLTNSRGALIGFSNSILGMLFYSLAIILNLQNFNTLFLMLITIGILFSVYLAYEMFFKIRKVCVVCLLSYIINFLILFEAIHL